MQPKQETPATNIPVVIVSLPEQATSATPRQPEPQATPKTAPSAPTKKTASAPTKATPPPQQQISKEKAPKEKAKDLPLFCTGTTSTALALHVGKVPSWASSLINPENLEGHVSIKTRSGQSLGSLKHYSVD
jgi:hypothetical protein